MDDEGTAREGRPDRPAVSPVDSGLDVSAASPVEPSAAPDPATTEPPLVWRFFIRGATTFLRVLFRWRLQVRVEGEVQPAHRPAVLVANHTGNLEPFLVAFVVWRATGHWMQPLVKAELFRVPVLRWLAPRAGAIPVERGSARGRVGAYAAAVDRLRAGGTIYVAPEGTITHDGRLLPLRRGAARLAIEADAPVMVVTTFGGQRAFSPVVTLPHVGAVFSVVVRQLELDPDEDADALTGRIAATMLDDAEELREGYPQADHDAPWWPPYSEPAEPSSTGRESLERYRDSMAESVERARERMAALTGEHDIDERVAAARERARTAADTARERAAELSDQLRTRADELVELARTGTLGDELRHRAEDLAAQARHIANEAAALRAERRERRDGPGTGGEDEPGDADGPADGDTTDERPDGDATGEHGDGQQADGERMADPRVPSPAPVDE